MFIIFNSEEEALDYQRIADAVTGYPKKSTANKGVGTFVDSEETITKHLFEIVKHPKRNEWACPFYDNIGCPMNVEIVDDIEDFYIVGMQDV